jgi:hypothetical protein
MDTEEQVKTKDEPIMEFKMISDRSVYAIINDEINQTLIEISGYDLMININMEYINSIADVETAVGGVADLFRQIIMDKLLEYKKQNA